MREDVLEEELRPARDAELRGPAGQRLAARRAEQVALAERAVDEYRHPLLLRERQQARLGLAVERVVAELHEVERMLARLVPRLAARRSRRLTPTHGRGHVDLRRSFRHALRSEGDLVRLARRSRALEQPSLVVLYDTSGSMAAYTRLLLAFAFALRRRVKKVEIFAFNTSLVRVTRMISPAEVVRNLNQKMTSQKLSGHQFVTCCYCLLNLKTRQLTFARAGHPYPILLRQGQPPQQLEARGALLGIFEKTKPLPNSISESVLRAKA